MRNGHCFSLANSTTLTARTSMTKHEEHLHCQIPYFFMDELAKHDYEHSQHQAEGLSNDVNT